MGNSNGGKMVVVDLLTPKSIKIFSDMSFFFYSG
jgi:hypothetical protein